MVSWSLELELLTAASTPPSRPHHLPAAAARPRSPHGGHHQHVAAERPRYHHAGRLHEAAAGRRRAAGRRDGHVHAHRPHQSLLHRNRWAGGRRRGTAEGVARGLGSGMGVCKRERDVCAGVWVGGRGRQCVVVTAEGARKWLTALLKARETWGRGTAHFPLKPSLAAPDCNMFSATRRPVCRAAAGVDAPPPRGPGPGGGEGRGRAAGERACTSGWRRQW